MPTDKQSGKPSSNGGKRPGAGRPRGAASKLKLEIEAQAQVHAHAALEALVNIASKGLSEPARVSAAVALLDRGYGKPRQALEHAGKDGGPIVVQAWKFGDKLVTF